MAIYKLIANGSFGPDEIEAMSAAYESALVNLGIVNREIAIRHFVTLSIASGFFCLPERNIFRPSKH